MNNLLYLSRVFIFSLALGLIFSGCDFDSAQDTVPYIPLGVSAAASSSVSSIKIKWPHSTGANAYYIYRSTSEPGTYSKIGSTKLLYYDDDTDLMLNTAYYYKISAYNESGESALSKSVSATTYNGVAAPTGLSALADSLTSITVSWTQVPNADEYYIYSNSSSKDTFLGSTAATSYTITGLSPGTYYTFKVSAFNNTIGESFKSDKVTESTNTAPGARSTNAITLNQGDYYIEYSFYEEWNEMWFTFSAFGPGSLRVHDMAYAKTLFTADVIVDVYVPFNNSSLNLTHVTINGISQTKIDLGDGLTQISAYDWRGTYYVQVRPKYGSNSICGTFALCFW